MGRTKRDEVVMAAFLEATDHLSAVEAGRRVDLTAERIRQYRRGEWTRMFGSTRRRLEAFVADRGDGDVELLRDIHARLRQVVDDLSRLTE
ncbi:MAG: hypothetical protein ACPGVY_16620 [Mycobacterium sp.]